MAKLRARDAERPRMSETSIGLETYSNVYHDDRFLADQGSIALLSGDADETEDNTL